MTLQRAMLMFIHDLEKPLQRINFEGEPAWVIDNVMMEDVEWELIRLLHLDEEIMIGGMCPRTRGRRVHLMRWV